MIQLIMKIEGVRAVHQITVSDGHNDEAWYLDLNPTKSPVLADVNESHITLVRGKANATTDLSRVTTFLRALQDASRFKSLSDSERMSPSRRAGSSRRADTDPEPVPAGLRHWRVRSSVLRVAHTAGPGSATQGLPDVLRPASGERL
jgi:hypothetical protein